MISYNLYDFIQDRLKLDKNTALLIIGKEKDLSVTIDLFLRLISKSENTTMVYYVAELQDREICLKNKGFRLVNKKFIKWTFTDEFLEVFGKSCCTEVGDSLWENDQARLTRMRIDRILNRRIRNFIFPKVKISSSEYKLLLLTWPLLFFGLLLKFSRIKPKYDELLEFKDAKNNKIFVLRSQMYEKDHYGEAPLDIRKRKQIVHTCMNILSDYSQVGVMIFIGQRVRWYKDIADVVKKLSFRKATFFVFSAWRNSHKKELKSVSDGKFYAGSNTDLDSKAIFSPHCISIGALDHELWYKEVKKSLK